MLGFSRLWLGKEETFPLSRSYWKISLGGSSTHSLAAQLAISPDPVWADLFVPAAFKTLSSRFSAFWLRLTIAVYQLLNLER